MKRTIFNIQRSDIRKMGYKEMHDIVLHAFLHEKTKDYFGNVTEYEVDHVMRIKEHNYFIGYLYAKLEDEEMKKSVEKTAETKDSDLLKYKNDNEILERKLNIVTKAFKTLMQELGGQNE